MSRKCRTSCKRRCPPKTIVSERLKFCGSLARKVLIELNEKGIIPKVVEHLSQKIYTRMVRKSEEEDEAAAEDEVDAKKLREGRSLSLPPLILFTFTVSRLNLKWSDLFRKNSFIC